jgi:hypothetical protein
MRNAKLGIIKESPQFLKKIIAGVRVPVFNPLGHYFLTRKATGGT